MKKLLGLLFIIALVAGAFYFLKDKLPTSFIKEEIKPITIINSNEDSNIALIHQNENGDKITVITEKIFSGEIVKQITIENNAGETAVIELNIDGRPESFALGKDRLVFSNYTKTTVDIQAVYSDGSAKELNGVEIPKVELKTSRLIQAVNASAAKRIDSIVIKTPGRADRLDGKYYFEVVGTAWNVVACAGGLITNIIPNPISTFTAAVGCGSLLARNVTVEENDIEGCDSSDSLYNCILKKVFGDEEAYKLNGRVTINIDNNYIGVKNVGLEIVDKKGKTFKAVTGREGYFSLPVWASRAYSITAIHEDLAGRNFEMAISDDVILIKDEKGEDAYKLSDYQNIDKDFVFSMKANRVYVSSFSSRDPLNLGKGIHGDIDGNVRIEFLDDGSVVCELNMNGNINATADGAQSYEFRGPVYAKSIECKGESKDGKLVLSGKVNGDEPLPEGMTMEQFRKMESYFGGLMGPMDGQGFRIDTIVEGDVISGKIIIPRFSFQGPANAYMEFVATVE